MSIVSRTVFSLGVATLLIGCGEDSSREVKAVAEEESSPKIEIVEGSSSREVKVESSRGGDVNSSSYYYDYGVKSNYDLKSKPANPDASVKVRPRTVVDAFIQIRSPYEHVEVELLAKQLSKKFRSRCSACHSDYANGIIGPSLIGKDSDYIYERIVEFRSGEKFNPLMNDLVKMMSLEEIRGMADEIYSFNLEIKKMREKKR